MFSERRIKTLTLLGLIAVLILFFWGNHPSQNYVYSEASGLKAAEYVPTVSGMEYQQNDSVLNLLGLSFDEIRNQLGKPDKRGFSNLHGPHNYMSYELAEGPVLFCSPDGIDHKVAVSIILSGEHDVLGVKVGMTFLEIIDILGEPDFGPEPGMENRYYLDYHIGEYTSGAPQILISFSAEKIDSPTDDVFLKWEAFSQFKYLENVIH